MSPASAAERRADVALLRAEVRELRQAMCASESRAQAARPEQHVQMVINNNFIVGSEVHISAPPIVNPVRSCAPSRINLDTTRVMAAALSSGFKRKDSAVDADADADAGAQAAKRRKNPLGESWSKAKIINDTERLAVLETYKNKQAEQAATKAATRAERQSGEGVVRTFMMRDANFDFDSGARITIEVLRAYLQHLGVKHKHLRHRKALLEAAEARCARINDEL